MKYVFVILSALVFSSCRDQNSREEIFNAQQNSLPTGSRIIQTYNNRWMIWEFQGSCYLSRDVNSQYGLLTKTDCPR